MDALRWSRNEAPLPDMAHRAPCRLSCVRCLPLMLPISPRLVCMLCRCCCPHSVALPNALSLVLALLNKLEQLTDEGFANSQRPGRWWAALVRCSWMATRWLSRSRMLPVVV